MILSLYSGASGMRNHQTRMDVIGNNIANVNTVGYKSQRANFQDLIYQMRRYPAYPSDALGSINPAQVGSGVSVASINLNMEQGAMQSTGRSLDLAIQGNGFFCVVDGSSGNKFYTRNGVFIIGINSNSENCIVDSNGYQLTDESGNPITITGGNGQIGSIAISNDGTITAFDTSGEAMSSSNKIALFSFLNQEGLEKVGQNLYKETTNADTGETVSGVATVIDTVGTTSTINSGYLEMSNVNLTDEFTNMITTQRGYQANARTVTTSDQMLEELLNIKR